MSAKPFLSLLILSLCSLVWAQARHLAVYPFSSPDVILGVAVADRIATALEGQLEVYGPEVTPVLVPPLVVQNGFLNPLVILPTRDGIPVVENLSGAALLRETLGADAALTGEILLQNERFELTLFLATPDGVRRYRLSAPETEPGRLADRVLALLGAEFEVQPRGDTRIDLSGVYGDYAQVLALLGGGFLADARGLLQEALEQPGADPAWRALLADIEAVETGAEGSDPALTASLAIGQMMLTEQQVIAYFEAFAEARTLPVAHTWLGVLRTSVNDRAGANAAFETAAARYPFGAAARALYRIVNSLPGAGDDLARLEFAEGRGALFAGTLAAESLGDLTLQKFFASRLAQVAPDLPYPFERLSFIAFDEDDARAAAEALAVATSLQPDSNLYWTNFGWALYLLGSLERSEEASIRAVNLSPSQYIAWYNLGLVRVVTGRLEAALAAYEEALVYDAGVDEEALIDLENALDLFPNQPEIHFALGTLYEAAGRRTEAAVQFERFVARNGNPAFMRQAQNRIDVLRAPPPPIEATALGVNLGADGGRETNFRPGDSLFPVIELSTPGIELPREVVIEIELLQDGQPIEEVGFSQQITIAPNIVGFTVSDVGFDLPLELAPGRYTASLRISASDEREAFSEVSFEVSGSPSVLRQLLSRSVSLRALETNAPLYSRRDLNSLSDAALIDSFVQELRQSVELAEEVLPEIPGGRFAGLSGGALFSQTSPEDVADFLEFLLAQGGFRNVEYSFADIYAQWAIEGAPQE